ncbi:MAG: CRISPR-associated endonuclease Cas2 [Succinivibrionaceae bacterium]|jgi:CRISPR-associated protein Cas2|nr:CRISPR-associated endonuclease Cas2 [Succinivibrionaceae bacterium]MCI6200435.1 CRISPR-associated endonuclease Cas2 [Pseudomonadota bacterium]MDD6546467.1 CRISPR-associated endonuclease Cas2 [Pseudomonadota bacterium]MDY6275592.1 CRISPR-associated endonuclease Cas2 [Succinivibrionaceae bacterium]MDY6336881.1 CRISPR-associated endonuclease Cas2 [Succinivibrionaceae bacterium]
MLFFVMYDIESNKVRRTVATYLEKKGCQRIQKSVYLANLDSSVYEQIRSDLTEVQGMYENNDSIIFCQASVDELKSMDVIGHNLDLDLVLKGRNTMFF